jgi:hypothetical protein
LAKEISYQTRIQAVAWLLLAAFAMRIGSKTRVEAFENMQFGQKRSMF